MDAIVLLGAPGSGKGTVAEDIRKSIPFVHVSTGDMLRNAISAGTSVGIQAKRFMDRGALVPDEIIVKLVAELIESGKEDTRYMFDGFPRTNAQAREFDAVLSKHGSKVSYVFLLEVARPVLVRRICGRRTCRSCGAVYNVHTKRPKVEGICDFCGSKEIYQRPDDTEETLNNRLEVFQKQTAELIEYYDQKKVLVRVDAEDRLATELAIVKYLKG